MTCPHCGKYNTGSGKECEYCGRPLNVVSNKKPVRQDLGQANRTSVSIAEITTKSYWESRVGLGIISALALGLIGLFVGLLFFDKQPSKRSSFVKGWIIGAIIIGVIAIILVSVYASIIQNMLK